MPNTGPDGCKTAPITIDKKCISYGKRHTMTFWSTFPDIRNTSANPWIKPRMYADGVIC